MGNPQALTLKVNFTSWRWVSRTSLLFSVPWLLPTSVVTILDGHPSCANGRHMFSMSQFVLIRIGHIEELIDSKLLTYMTSPPALAFHRQYYQLAPLLEHYFSLANLPSQMTTSAQIFCKTIFNLLSVPLRAWWDTVTKDEVLSWMNGWNENEIWSDRHQYL